MDPSAAIGLLLSLAFLAPFCGMALGVAMLIFWIAMIIQCIQSRDQNKPLWLAVILLLGPIGAGVYFFFGRQSTRRVDYWPGSGWPIRRRTFTTQQVVVIASASVIGAVLLLCIGLFVLGATSGPPLRPTAVIVVPPVEQVATVAPTLISPWGIVTSIAQTAEAVATP